MTGAGGQMRRNSKMAGKSFVFGFLAIAAVLLLPRLSDSLSEAAGPAAPKPETTIYAASSLRAALEDLVGPCGREAGVSLVTNLGASSDLVRQIEAGGKADLFISADEALMGKLDSGKLLEPGTRRTFLSNQLVIIVPADAAASEGNVSETLRGARRLSLANPEAVPAGRYAKVWLEKAGLWEDLKKKVVPGVDARAALAAVESGAVDAGIVYRTDAFVTKKVKVIHEVPRAEAPAISYPIALLKDRPGLERSRKVLACLTGSIGKMVFETRGFVWLSQGP